MNLTARVGDPRMETDKDSPEELEQKELDKTSEFLKQLGHKSEQWQDESICYDDLVEEMTEQLERAINLRDGVIDE